MDAKGLGDGCYGIGFQISGTGIDFPQLLIGVDFHDVCFGGHPGIQDHVILIIKGFFPECPIKSGFCAHFSNLGLENVCFRLGQITDADHFVTIGIGFYQLVFPVYPDITLRGGSIADHIPGVQFPGVEGILRTPQVAGDHISIGEPTADQCQGVKIVLPAVLRVDHQMYTKSINKIFKPLLHKAHHYMDVCDTDFVKLADQPFDEDFAPDF